jgi:hypothetical protein
VDLIDVHEERNDIGPGEVKVELMIETTQSLMNSRGEANLPLMAQAARGRCSGAHFGTYDYTAGCNITAEYQTMGHPACDFAKHLMQIAFSGTGIFLSDGATTVMPVPPHRGADLTEQQLAENRQVVHSAWRKAYNDVRHSLVHGYYQGWDLHPGQLPIRYAACFSFFLESQQGATARLKNFVEQAAQASLVGDLFDDAATGQGLLNFFLRALNSGAIELEDVEATGLTLEEVQSRSFYKILSDRRRI